MANKNYSDDQVSRIQAPQRNLLINGQMDIWQRGTGPEDIDSTPTYHTADRWTQERTGAGLSTVQSSSTVPNSYYRNSLRVISTDTSAKNIFIWQRIEGDTLVPYIGKNMHVGAWVSCTVGDIVAGIYVMSNPSGSRDVWADAENLTKTSVKQDLAFTTVSGVWRYIGTNFTVTEECEDGVAIGFRFGTIDEVTSCYLTGCRLHVGDSKIDWSYLKRTYAAEDLLCKRYYYNIGSTEPIGVATAITSTSMRIEREHPVVMRTNPSVSSNSAQFRNYSTSSSGVELSTTYQNSNRGCSLVLTDTGLTTDNAYMIDTQSMTGGPIEFDAEL